SATVADVRVLTIAATTARSPVGRAVVVAGIVAVTVAPPRRPHGTGSAVGGWPRASGGTAPPAAPRTPTGAVPPVPARRRADGRGAPCRRGSYPRSGTPRGGTTGPRSSTRSRG